MDWDSPVPQAAPTEGQGEGTSVALVVSLSVLDLIDPGHDPLLTPAISQCVT